LSNVERFLQFHPFDRNGPRRPPKSRLPRRPEAKYERIFPPVFSLARYGVVELAGPRDYPQYNGNKERSIQDIRTYERLLRKHGYTLVLAERLDMTLRNLNEIRPDRC